MSRLEIIQNTFKSIKLKTKAFFQGEKWKEAVVFSFFVLLAFGFWLLKSLQQEYDIPLTFPVKYKHVPVNIAFNNPMPETITARIKDKGSILLNYSFRKSMTPIEIDMKTIDDKDSTFTFSRKQIEIHIQKHLLATTVLQSTDPQQINLTFSKRVHKKVPITFNGFVHLEAGYQISGAIQINPSSTNAYATAEVLNKIQEIQTEFTEIKKANNTISKNVSLTKQEGVNFDPSSVSIIIPIEEYTEKTLEIPVTCKDLPNTYTARMFPQIVKVTCSIPLSRFKELTHEMFSIDIPFEQMAQNVSGSLPVTLTKKPDWVKTITLSPEKVEFILEQNYKHD